MSLMSALNISAGALSVNSLGLQVVSNNISNVNTPGYAKQVLNQQAGPTYQHGKLTLGTGVQATGITQTTNNYLEEALREAIGDAEGSEVQSQIYQQLEAVLGELGTNDLSTYLSDFFGTLNEVANQPESISVRNLAIQQGQALANKINSLESQTREIQVGINTEISNSADRINSLLDEVNKLNGQITRLEGSNGGASAAAPLRDTRRTALKELGSLLDIRTTEIEGGSVNVSTATGESLLFNGEVSKIGTISKSVNGQPRTDLVLEKSGTVLQPQTGRLGGLKLARDGGLEEFLSGLNGLAQNLIYQFNIVHSAGQGLQGFQSVAAEFKVFDANKALNNSGLPFPPSNGSFQIHLQDKATGVTSTSNVYVTLGDNGGTSLQDLSNQLNAIDGLTASIDYQGRLSITSDDSNSQFFFSNDTSGALASLGINTFFSGSSASTIGVQSSLKANPASLAVSAGGLGADSNNILKLIDLEDSKLSSLNGNSIRSHYETMVGNVANQGAIARDIADGFRQYADSVEGQALAVGGVNLDEEAVKMMQYQRAYQASARVVQTVNEMFDVLVNL